LPGPVGHRQRNENESAFLHSFAALRIIAVNVWTETA
jgi:hypothetical protein